MAHRCGFYRALVTNITDPEQRGRIKVQCPHLWGSGQTDWVWPMTLTGPPALPPVGSQVFIGFEGGDEDHPLWFGAQIPTIPPAEQPGVCKGFLGSIAPVGYLIMIGQLLSVALYGALFNIVGTTFGGDGANNFGMPDMRGVVPIGAGQGSGRTNRPLWSIGGEETHILTVAELASHGHTDGGHTHGNTTGVSAHHTHNPDSAGNQMLIRPGSSTLGLTNSSSFMPVTATIDTTSNESNDHTHATNTGTASIGSSGSGTAHNNMQPWLAWNWMVKT